MIRTWKIDYAAVHDGPGIRTAIYLKGCPLRCIWCSNPEGQRTSPELVFKQGRCMHGCRFCEEKCPVGAIEIKRYSGSREPEARLNRKACNLCGECVSACPPKALDLWGRDYPIDDLMKIIEKNRPGYRKSGGGITLTGGEPLFQGPSVLELLERCRRDGIHTAVETSAYAESKTFGRVLENVDCLFIDLKHMSEEAHLRLTGKPNDLILENVRRASTILAGRNRPLVIRSVLVPGINDGENIYKAGEFLRSLPYITGLEFLPYHRYGVHKYALLDRSYGLPEVGPPSEEMVEECKKIMAGYHIAVMENT